MESVEAEKTKFKDEVKRLVAQNWYDVPSDEMTLEQARQAVKDLRKMWAERLEQEPCEDAISRQAVLDGVDRYIYKSQSTGTQDDFYSFAELVVKQLPSVTPQPKTGHWIKDDITERSKSAYKHKCDRCGAYHRAMYDYCPSCGAKMEEQK